MRSRFVDSLQAIVARISVALDGTTVAIEIADPSSHVARAASRDPTTPSSRPLPQRARSPTVGVPMNRPGCLCSFHLRVVLIGDEPTPAPQSSAVAGPDSGASVSYAH
jgi:hypothetical protein